MQKTWCNYVLSVSELCTTEFWDTFRILRHEPQTVADQILSKIYNILKRASLPAGHRWPTSVRSLNERIRSKAGCFWDNVLHEGTINLRRFGLPGVGHRVKFTFVDPLFVFLQQCNKLITSGHELVWKPCLRQHPRTGAHIYGAGVECGLLLRAAANSIPRGDGRVALMNLSWDGGLSGIRYNINLHFFHTYLRCETQICVM